MKRSVLLFAILMGMATVKAANPERIDTLKIYKLQNVQVLSTRASKKTPIAYSGINKQQIKAMNYGKDMTSILSMTPSVIMSSDAGTGIGYTGIHVRGTDPTRINITTNGVPMNDAESALLYWVNMSDFASSLENIQIQRGVGTSTNGAGSFGASVNMQTENINTTPYVGLDVSGGSYYTHKETFRFGTGLLRDHWAFQGRLSNISSNGYIRRASADLGSYFLQGGYFSDNTIVKFITFNNNEKTYHAWDYASKADMNKYGRRYNPCGEYINANGQTDYYKNQTDNYHQQNYQILLNQIINADLTFNAAVHYTKGHGYYEQYKADAKLYKYWLSEQKRTYSDLVRQKIMDNDFYGAIASFNYDNKKGLSANIGGGWNKYDGDHFGEVIWVRTPAEITINPNQRYYFNNAKKTDGNVYGKINYELIPGMNAYVDLQYRHIDYKSTGTSQEFEAVGKQVPLAFNKKYDFFNPKAGIVYDINENNTIYISYAIAHKEPTRNDFEDMLGESTYVMPKAERLNDLEVGYKFNCKYVTAGANFYYMDYDNQFVPTGAQDSNGELVARNIKKSYRMGIELMADVHPFDGFNWNINATWSKNRAKNMNVTVIDVNTWAESTENIGETHLAFSPDFILNNMFTYEYKGIKASLISKYVGKQYMTNTNFKSYIDEDDNNASISALIDKFFVSNFDLSYEFKLRGIKSIAVGATVYNIFNETYESNGSCALNFKKDNNNNIVAFNNHNDGFWTWSTYSAQAPTHVLAHVSLNF